MLELEVYSTASAVDELVAARKETVISNGRVEGIRLRDDLAMFGLASGDMLVAIDGKHITALEQVTPYLQKPGPRIKLLVARLRRFGTIELVEH
jgi:type II secretory pathway component PulC